VWDACYNGDLEEVKRLVEEEGAGIEFSEKKNWV